ncbi:MAG: Holliday junction branch migration protein RuvA [Clostridia bacterium]|nr:Holliday junction branch migration protein RuvA [Clostridia bacterium]
MFDYLSGSLQSVSVGALVLDTHGIGWSMIVSAKTAGRLSGKGTAKVYTYLSMGSGDRPSMTLYGFATPEEREMFLRLTDVSGIGPKVAISILSALTPEELSMCVLAGDAKALTVAQGLGMKGAQKIILELKDKIAKTAVSGASATPVGAASAPASDITEAVNALVVLGYQPQVAASAVRAVADRASDLQDLIRLALKSMGV